MKSAERDILLYLEDMVLSMQRIHEYISELDFLQFKKDYKTIDAVIRNLEIIGEASKKLSSSFKENYPEIPWEQMYRLRNRIAHEYFGVDYEIIWNIASNYLPGNHSDLIRILRIEKSKSRQ